MSRRTIRSGALAALLTMVAVIAWASTAVARPAHDSRAAGGTVTVALGTSSIDHMDPALWYYATTWTIADATCTTLLRYPDASGQAGTKLVPGLAALPTASNGGKSWTFRWRSGATFSNGKPITTADMKYTFERALDPKLAGPAPYFFTDIVGVNAFEKGKTKHVSGIVATSTSLTFKLTGRSGSLPQRVSMKWLCPVPVGTAVKPIEDGSLPSTGPYMIKSYTPARELDLVRNPSYNAKLLGSRGKADEIKMPIGVDPQQALLKVKAGEIDTYIEPLLAGPANQALRDPSLKGRVFSYAEAGIHYIWMNNDVPPFDNVKVRQAVNYAIDRNQIAKIVGGFGVARPTDQILPPTMAGWRDYHAYPLGGNLAKARQLMSQSGVATPVSLRVDCYDGDVKVGEVVQQELAKIGIRITLHIGPSSTLDPVQDKRSNRVPMGMVQGWTQDYPDPEDFFTPLLDPRLADQPGHKARFDDKSAIPMFQRAFSLTGPARFAAYQKLDETIMRRWAPWVPLFNTNDVFVISNKVTGFVFHPIYNRVNLSLLAPKS
ncbi:MAG TPA: ABC transporter substrate-binding protein [Gaiellaceae bacterium]|jgi:ABC-type transport system substrate-binding protein|nr:ABC transporter substrate-binding protein [Gaiellaceae bacterium]